jgi:hypothetical protein
VLVDVKLDSDEQPRTELDLTDFVVREEICRLMDQFDRLKNARIERIEVHAGVPRRVVFESRPLYGPKLG